MPDYAAARRNMVDGQVRTFDVTDRAILAAMEEVPREAFLPVERAAFAYLDQHLASPGAAGDDVRVMLAPMVFARMVQALGVEIGSRALDVGGGYGYSSAILARLGARVTLLEPRADVAGAAAGSLASLGLDGRVTFASGPLEAGAADAAPFDVILVNGSVQVRPERLLGQLADGGRLACIEDRGRSGQAMLFVRSGDAFGARPLFDATSPVLPGFKAPAGFTF